LDGLQTELISTGAVEEGLPMRSCSPDPFTSIFTMTLSGEYTQAGPVLAPWALGRLGPFLLGLAVNHHRTSPQRRRVGASSASPKRRPPSITV
jgi:hypothetical protein